MGNSQVLPPDYTSLKLAATYSPTVIRAYGVHATVSLKLITFFANEIRLSKFIKMIAFLKEKSDGNEKRKFGRKKNDLW